MKTFKRIYSGLQGVRIENNKPVKLELFASVISDMEHGTSISVVDPERDIQYVVPFDAPLYQLLAHVLSETGEEKK